MLLTFADLQAATNPEVAEQIAYHNFISEEIFQTSFCQDKTENVKWKIVSSALKMDHKVICIPALSKKLEPLMLI